MPKSERKNSYREFLKKKCKFDEKVKKGFKFKDTDGDGLCDYEEKYLYGTDPKNPDSDNDGMSDGNEVKNNRNPLGSGTLKDLFIPHAGNNYQPHALKPKRLLFHALSIVAIKSIVVIFVLFYPMSAWLSPDMALAEAKKIVELTNNLRQEISLPALLENQRLTQAAWQKVEDMVLNQYFAHVSPTGLGLKNWLEKINYKYSIAGENLAVGFSKAEDVVVAWKNSPTHYENIIDGGFKEIGVAMADGKFNQVDTAYIAQYFGAPAKAERSAGEVVEDKKNTVAQPSVKPAAANSQTPETAVEGEKVSIPESPTLTDGESLAATTVLALNHEIIIDQKAAALSIKNDPLNDGKVIRIVMALPEDTVSAEVIVNNEKINLNKATDQANQWSGAAIINKDEEKDILNPLIPASVAVTDSSGRVSYGKIDWDEAKIIEVTPLEHYQLYKNYPAAAMAPIMGLSNLYFKLILAIALIALLLNVFIEIKKQHPHIIFYSFAFIGLLVTMIIF